MIDFCHLHSHTQYSLLDGASEISSLMKKAKSDNQSAVAITDHGNMFGVFKFVREANKHDIKPIIGCEFYIVEDRHIKSFEKSRGQKDKRYHQLLLAKNETGYRNLMKLCSLGFTEGLYGKYPRIDKELLEQYHEGLIATSCCIGAEIPQTILTGNIEEAESKLQWWYEMFGEDFYIELQRQSNMDNIDGTGMSQEDVNQQLLKFAKKYNIKAVVTNDSHYLEPEDYKPHDILLCVNTGSRLEDENRFQFPSNDFYFKTKAEMNNLFGDIKEAIENTMEVASKIETIKLERDVLLPAFPIPPTFKDEMDYLRHLTFEGAKKKYVLLTGEVEDRLNFELETIAKSGYAGYFLIVQDFTTEARKMGVSVGPGRGSAAGSCVAYCLGITNIDPIKYDLLFERFLNPERVSMPDIDIDFDDEGRGKVIDYVVDKYGQNQVAQIVTYGTMAAKSALKDVGRVMDIPLPEVEKVTKIFPANLSATLNKILEKDDISPKLKPDLTPEDLEKAYEIRKLEKEDSQIGQMVRMAKKLEGSVRNTGIHACGVIITPQDITNFIPVATAKDSDLLVSQYDNSVAESAGLLKMDFLGLKTLTIINDTIKIIKERYNVDLDIDSISLDDEETFKVFQSGYTIGLFQYESVGMQKYLKELSPTRFEDLIAMNALFRPGPLQYIPDFIARKNGQQAITYDLPEMEEFLSETYGITVYQEQVMLLSQKLAGFTKGDADVLRKAIGKKQKDTLDKMFAKFVEGCVNNGHPEKTVKKIWSDWEAFASYAFNKSHSTCYAYIGFQTAYLKAHYPAAFMASVLNHNKNDISKINFYLEEAKRMKIDVLGPDVNESNIKFTVNTKDQIRFGLSALKGVGEAPTEEIVNERKNKGSFTDIYDMVHRLSLRSVNKKSMESLILGGAVDSFNQFNRAQFLTPNPDTGDVFLETLMRYGANFQAQESSNQMSLFGDAMTEYIEKPKPPKIEEWGQLEKLEREKEVTGIYLSGHPLDDYKLEFKNFINCSLDKINQTLSKPLKLGGIITDVFIGTSLKGTGYAKFTISDHYGSYQFNLRNENFEAYKHLLSKGQVLYIEGSNEKFYNGDGTYFKVTKIMLLDTIGKNMTKSITIKLPLQKITDQLMYQLQQLCINSEGPHLFKLKIVDNDDEYGVDLISSNIKVNADYQFIKELDYMEISYKIN